jgi:hypothetical protein
MGAVGVTPCVSVRVRRTGYASKRSCPSDDGEIRKRVERHALSSPPDLHPSRLFRCEASGRESLLDGAAQPVLLYAIRGRDAGYRDGMLRSLMATAGGLKPSSIQRLEASLRF